MTYHAFTHGLGRLVAHRAAHTIDLKRVIDRRLKMGIADGTMEMDGEAIYLAKDMRVVLFS